MTSFLTQLQRLIIDEVSGVADPANQLPGWMVTKTRDGSSVLNAAEKLRKAVGNDAIFERVVKAMVTPGEFVFFGVDGIHVLRKARHDGRQHPHTGRFTSMAEPQQTRIAGGLVMTHQDTREGLARQLLDAGLFGKREPSRGGDPNARTSATHDGVDEDPQGLRSRTEDWLKKLSGL
jgi:hypothetical protein